MTEIIYILYFPYQDMKIGSTRYLKSRMFSYQTNCRDFNDDTNKLVIFKFETTGGINCYMMDKLINNLSKEYGFPFNKSENCKGGGKEFYAENHDLSNLEKLFNILEIKYQKENVSINHLLNNNENSIENTKEIHVEKICEKEIDDNLYSKLINIVKESNILRKCQIELRKWQVECEKIFFEFIKSNEMGGVICVPTGCGKTFFMQIMTIYYILQTNNNVLLITKNKEIFEGLSNEINKNLEIMGEKKIKVFDLINDRYDRNIFETNEKTIFIINSDKFISSTNFKNYEKYSLGKIKLIFFDECQWCSSEKNYEFLEYFRNTLKIKIVGLSATPFRELNKHHEKYNKLFGNNDNKINILYQRSIIEALNDNDIILPTYNYYLVDESDYDNTEKKNNENNKSIIYHQLNDKGLLALLDFIWKKITETNNKKGILWFGRVDELKECEKIIKSKNYFNNIKIFKSYSENSHLNNQINEFKEQIKNAILLVVNRAVEGFDVPLVEFAMKMYLVKKGTPMLEYQRYGRLTRTHNTKKEANYYTLISENSKDAENIIINEIAKTYEMLSFNKIINNKEISKVDSELIDLICRRVKFNSDKLNILTTEKIKGKLLLKLGNNYKSIIQKENEERYQNNDELIITKKEITEFLKKTYEIDFYPNEKINNWVKYATGDKIFTQLTQKYYYSTNKSENQEVIVKACEKLDICNSVQYIKNYQKDNKLPPIKFINSGFYYDIHNRFNLTLILNQNIYDLDN